MHPFVFFFVAVIVMLVIVAFASKAEAKRRAALLAWSRTRGLSFESEHNDEVEYHFREFDCFAKGSDRYGYHMMQGEMLVGGGEARPIWCFDYHYETYSTDSKGNRSTHHHHSSNVIIEYGQMLKDLTIRREGFFDKVTGFFGYQDIDFESAEFSRRFHVTAKERKWAFDVISQRAMEVLLEAPNFRIKMAGSKLLVRRASRITPDEYDAALSIGHSLLDEIPHDSLVS